jgi:hypothetical protein
LNGENIRFIGCNFSEVTNGVVVDVDASDAMTKNIRVVSSNFDGVARSAIKVQSTNVGTITSVMSSMNYYGDVGTAYAGAGNAAYPVLNFEGSGNYSTGDFFERSEADHAVQPRVYIQSRAVSVGFSANTGITLGMQTQSPARVLTLNASANQANTGIVFSGTTTSATVSYFLKSETANAYRQGKIDIIRQGTNVQYIDEYIEYPNATTFVYPGPTGVTFEVTSVNASTAILRYTNGLASTANLTYSITTTI